MRQPLIEDYAIVGDLHTAALVSREGSIDWLCLPHFDSPSCFAALLDEPRAGRWSLRPTAQARAKREYRGETLVLETTWTSHGGTARVIDFMPVRDHRADLVRIVEGVSGHVRFESRMRLSFDYGSMRPWLEVEGKHASAVSGPDLVWLHADVEQELDGDDIAAEFTVAAGERVTFTLTHVPAPHREPDRRDPYALLEHTTSYWERWIGRCEYEGRWGDAVRRALITLKALTYEPTGGIAAAATTSLPEQLGGPRNWDYRYCWLRDSALTLEALLETGYTSEAKAWREWLVRAVGGDPAKLQIMYGLDGRRRLVEQELPWLDGYGGAKPARIGNAAADQHQLDVWGEVLDGLWIAREAGLHPEHDAWSLQLALTEWLEGNWQDPDNGLWEVRGDRRHFVHSKVMAWVGIDRMIRSVERDTLDGPVDRWRKLRDEIHAEVCRKGYDEKRNTFTQFYGSKGLDAALLLLPRLGFLPYDDPRIVGTVEAVQRELDHDGLVLRYDPTADGGVDGLPGSEGAFLACSFWLADALHGIGRTDDAERLFNRLLDVRNDVGLLSEEWDPETRRQLGNTPQAFSLVGLVNTARTLSAPPEQIRRRGDEAVPPPEPGRH